MPVTIVLDSPARHVARRLLRRSTTMLGGGMVLCGLVTASPLLPLGLLAIAGGATLPDLLDTDALARVLRAAIDAAGTDSAAAGGGMPADRLRAVVLASIAWVAISVFLLVAGFRLLRRHRALVLFLRRFHHHHATTAVSYAVATTIGSGWRLVTLDDGGVEPIGARRSVRALLGAVRRAVVLTRLPVASAYVVLAAAIGMVSVFALDVLSSVYWRNGALDLDQVQVLGRQMGASALIVVDAVGEELGVSSAVLLALIVCAIVALVVVGGLRAWRRGRRPRRPVGPLRQRAVTLVRRAPPRLIQVIGVLLLVEASRSWHGLTGALDAGAWLRIAQPYLIVLTELLDQRLPAEMVAGTLPGTFALLACIGALAALAGVIAVLVMLGSAVLLAPMWLFISSSTRAMERADRNRMEVQSEWDLRKAASEVSAASRYALAPRLIVLRVRSALWQRAVREFLEISSVSLIDVSDPTDNVLWELERITASGAPCVAIGEHRNVLALADAARAGPSGLESPARRLAQLLDGRPVLAYTTDRDGTARFARALRNQLLEASWQTRSPVPGRDRHSTAGPAARS